MVTPDLDLIKQAEQDTGRSGSADPSISGGSTADDRKKKSCPNPRQSSRPTSPPGWTACLGPGFTLCVVVALGITWVLDGLEVTVAGSIAGALQESPVLHFTAAEVGLVGSAYLVGAVTGAVLFGYLTDRFGRKRLFMVTLGIYLTATAATALSWDFWSFALFRALTGAGIGGEYTAINSAIQELIPARFRGRTDLAINGSFWLGAALGAGGAIAFLHPGFLPPDWGWRAAFGIGAVLGLFILGLRQFIPESPRWLILHGRAEEAENVTQGHRAAGRARRRDRAAETARRADSARRQLATRRSRAWSSRSCATIRSALFSAWC